jgi:hypothetical protein
VAVLPVDSDGDHVHERRGHVAVEEEWKDSGSKNMVSSAWVANVMVTVCVDFNQLSPKYK